MISPAGHPDYVALLTDEAIAYAHKLMADTVDLAQDVRRHNLVTVTSLLEVIKDRHTLSTVTHYSTRSAARCDESSGAMKTPAVDSQPHNENGKQEKIE